jgi:hypothetical protein
VIERPRIRNSIILALVLAAITPLALDQRIVFSDSFTFNLVSKINHA